MATMENRVTALETRVSAIEAVLTQMHERLNDIRAWLMALTGLAGAPFAAMVGWRSRWRDAREEGPMRTWTRGLAAVLVLGVVVVLAVPAAAPATLEERVARLEGIIEQIDARLRTLEWMVGLSMAWNTMLVGAAVGVLLKYR